MQATPAKLANEKPKGHRTFATIASFASFADLKPRRSSMGENSAVITGTCLDCGKVTDEPMTCSDGSVFCFDCYD